MKKDVSLFSSCHSNERLFLRDFVSSSAGTSGGRLARWLQPDSFVDPSKCEALYSREEMRCGWPAIVTILTRDQYGEIVHVPGLKVHSKFLFMYSITFIYKIKYLAKITFKIHFCINNNCPQFFKKLKRILKNFI